MEADRDEPEEVSQNVSAEYGMVRGLWEMVRRHAGEQAVVETKWSSKAKQ